MSALDNAGHWLQGRLLPASDGATIPIQDPATGAALGELPQAGDELLAEALTAAERAYERWARVPAYDRQGVLRGAARLLRERVDTLARTMTLEQGKPLGEARGEWLLCADALEWAADEGRRAYGRVIPARAVGVSQVVHKFPVGPVAAFAPWNFPAFSPTQKVAPALAAGCSVVLKPASDTPLCAVELARALTDAGLPPDVLNVVHGSASRLSEVLVASDVIRKVSLTGSVEVGRTLAALAGRHLKKCTMELGGHAPVIVLQDADVERVAALAVGAKYRNAGQVCTSPTRFLVEARVYERFAAAFVSHARALVVGNGLEPGTQMGPLANARQVRTMQRLVADAQDRGAEIALGGHASGGRGCFFEPTVICHAPEDAAVRREEPFGPIAILLPVADLDEAIRRANELPYGLAAYCFTNHSSHIDRITREVQTGMLAFNQFQAGAVEAPFGGVRDSGFGAEGGTEGVDGYLVTKFVSHRVV